MKDRVPKDGLGTSRLNDVFLKIHPYESTSKFQECERGSHLTFMQSKIKSVRRFFETYEKVKSKIAQNHSYRLLFFQILASNAIHPYKSTVKISNNP